MGFKKTLIPEYIFYLVSLAFVIFVRARFSDMAMERDEGEYAYAAAQILRGGFPYLDFYNMKLPGVYYFYATIFFCFGKSIQAIRFCVLALTIINSFFIKKLNEKWFDERAGWLAAGIYLIAAISTNAQGLVSNCEHFVLFFFLITVLSLTHAHYFLAGLSAAFCILMKQQGIILLVFGVIYGGYEVYKNKKETSILTAFLKVLSGFALPFMVFFIVVWQKNAFGVFKFFVIDYARHYVGERDAKPFYFEPFLYILNQYQWFWKEAVVAILIALSYLFFKKKTQFLTPYNPALLLLLSVCAYLAVLPGWYFRPHYFLYIHLPLALLAGYGLAWFYAICKDKSLKMVYILLLLVSLSTAIYDQYPIIGKYKNEELTNLMYGYDTFNEIRAIGQVLKLNAHPEDRIGQMANEPQLYFYADLKAASGYLYNYPFYEKQPFASRMLEAYFKEMETAKPRWYIKNLNEEKWSNNNKQKMLDWANQFEKAYILRGVVYGKNQWEKIIQWNVSKIEPKDGWNPLLLIFERVDSATVKPLIIDRL